MCVRRGSCELICVCRSVCVRLEGFLGVSLCNTSDAGVCVCYCEFVDPEVCVCVAGIGINSYLGTAVPLQLKHHTHFSTRFV